MVVVTIGEMVTLTMFDQFDVFIMSKALDHLCYVVVGLTSCCHPEMFMIGMTPTKPNLLKDNKDRPMPLSVCQHQIDQHCQRDHSK